MIVLIVNYDSFTFNLFHYLGELGAEVVVHRNDKVTAAEVVASDPEAIVLSPGPCDPDRAGICLDIISRAGPVVPPTGHSTKAAPLRRTFSASASSVAGCTVLISMKSLPCTSPARSPSGPP